MGKQVKRTRRSTTEKVGGDIGQCRWVLRQTKIRQARVSRQITCQTNPTKNLAKKRKLQPPSVPSEVRSEKSCVGESSLSVVKAVYVKNLPKNITQDRLKELFEHHGKITKVVLPSAKLGHAKSRFGFVHFMERSSAMKALKTTEKYEIDGQVLECFLAKPPADQKSQQQALLPTYPPADQKSQQPALLPIYPPWLGYGLVGGAYGALGAGYGGAGFGQPMMYGPTPMMYGPTPMMYGPTPGMAMMPMLLPDGRIGYVLQQPAAQGPPQQSSSTGGSSSGGRLGSVNPRGGSCYNPY